MKVCPFVCCRVYAFVSCVAYVWTRGRAWLRGRERRDAQPSWRVCAPVFVRPHVFVWKRLAIVVPLVFRVYLFRVVSRGVRASRLTGVVSAARCVACIGLCRVLVSAAHFF